MAQVSELLQRAQDILNDAGFVRWTKPELLRWLNDGMRDLLPLDPTACQKTATVILADGAMQTLPAEAVQLLDVVGNVQDSGAPGRQIRLVSRPTLDAAFPKWQMESSKPYVSNVMYDVINRKIFWVYPPAQAGVKIDLVYSYIPSVVADTDNVPVDAMYQTPLVDYVLFRAFSKETEQQSSAARAAAHLQAFSSAVNTIVAMRGGNQPKE